jgi:hypothetical protein
MSSIDKEKQRGEIGEPSATPATSGPIKKNRHNNRPSDAEEKHKMKQAPPPRDESHTTLMQFKNEHSMAYAIKSLRKIQQYKNRRLVQLQIKANIIRNPHKNSHCAVTRSKIGLKRRNKIITVEITSHLHKHNVLKSICEDRKDGNRAIVRSFRRRTNFWNWDDIENLPGKGEFRERKDKVRHLSKQIDIFGYKFDSLF